ncbi:MAG: SMP-30/gluconolactonase/LRE family protein [Colwellia sp.]
MKKYYIALLPLLVFLQKSYAGEKYQVSDWVTDKVFTQGIEGPAIDKNGNLYAVNFGHEGTIGIINNSGQAKLYLTLPKGSTGNSIRFNQTGDMFIADYTGHNILKVAANSTVVSVYAHNDKMSQPNDIAIMKSGVLFASDPNWANSSGQLWRIDLDGSTRLIEENMGTTNGIEVSQDQKHLYVNESVQRKVWVYDINANNNLTNKRLLIEFSDFGLDGMHADTEGNIYIARYGKGVIAKVSPTGKLLKEIVLKGQYPTNITLDNKKHPQAYVTMQKRGAIETFSIGEQPRVVGYIPTFKGLTAGIEQTDLTKVTHLNIAFLNPNSNGDLLVDGRLACMPNGKESQTLTSELHYAVKRAHQAGVKVLASMAGGVIPSCSGDWSTLLQAKNRTKLVNIIINFIDEFELDGIDIDIEGVILTDIDNHGNYTPFIRALSNKLKPQNKLLTCATASYVGGMIPVSSIEYFDFVTLMSYDAIGPSWGKSGSEHSTYQQAVEHVDLWKKRGLSKEKLVLGLPFYGYGFGSYAPNYSFKEVVDQFGEQVIKNDIIGKVCENCNYITYNGLSTIKVKTQLALKEGSGVMIWELTHDIDGPYSVLTTINKEIQHISDSSQ